MNVFTKILKARKGGLNYAIAIYLDNDYYWFNLFSRGEDTGDDPKLIKEWEQDNKDIEAWLKKHNLFDDTFYFNGRWSKEFKFPQQEKELYEFTKKVIELLEKDVESICSK